MANKNLTGAKRAKKDEFYTQLGDINNELCHYKAHFKGKTVLCNCDDPYESEFFRYFVLNFNHLGLKKLITTCYQGSPLDDNLFDRTNTSNKWQNMKKRGAHKFTITEVKDENGDGCCDLEDVRLFIERNKEAYVPLSGNGDFRSKECVELLKEADIVVTNPPFSLFREYVEQLFKHNKRFLIIGHQNAITYKEIFPLIKENKIWLGYGFKGSAGHFFSPYEDIASAGNHKKGMIRVSGVHWFTNLDIDKRHEPLILYKKYTPEDYPNYDNYDAVEVGRTNDIPMDYEGVMGVPITFLDKYSPEQFEIVGATESEGRGFSMGLWDNTSKVSQPLVNTKKKFKRIFIKHKKYGDKTT